MEEYRQAASDQLMRELSAEERVRVAANAEKSVSAWVTTIPHQPELVLTNANVAAGLLRDRLLLEPTKIKLDRRKVLDQRILNEFKKAEYQTQLTTTSTTTSSDDPDRRLSDSLVEPMIISVTNFNLSQTVQRGRRIPDPPSSSRRRT